MRQWQAFLVDNVDPDLENLAPHKGIDIMYVILKIKHAQSLVQFCKKGGNIPVLTGTDAVMSHFLVLGHVFVIDFSTWIALSQPALSFF